MFDLTKYATGGATRPDSFSGMNGDFSNALAQMFASAPPEIQAQLQVSSGYRSPERQAQLWAEALKKYGSPEVARKWVAPPGNSQHNHGNAADLRFLSPDAQAWVHQNAQNYGLSFPLSNENWHIELAGARGGGHTAPNAMASANVSVPQQNPLAPQQRPQPQFQWANMQQDPAAFMSKNAFAAPIYNQNALTQG